MIYIILGKNARLSVWSLLAGGLILLAIGGCRQRVSTDADNAEATKAEKARGSSSVGTGGPAESEVVLKADPNPVPNGLGPGKTTITWSTRDKAFNQIFVWVEGNPEKLFVQGGPGSQDVDWIWPNTLYEFRMYAGKEHKQLLAVLRVRQE